MSAEISQRVMGNLPPDQSISVVWSGEHSIDGEGGSDCDSQERDPLDVVDQV